MFYLVTYDLNQSGQRYDDLISKIREYSCVHVMQSVWFIETPDSAQKVYDKLSPYLDSNDFIFVEEINSNHQGWLPQKAWDFLEK